MKAKQEIDGRVLHIIESETGKSITIVIQKRTANPSSWDVRFGSKKKMINADLAIVFWLDKNVLEKIRTSVHVDDRIVAKYFVLSKEKEGAGGRKYWASTVCGLEIEQKSVYVEHKKTLPDYRYNIHKDNKDLNKGFKQKDESLAEAKDEFKGKDSFFD